MSMSTDPFSRMESLIDEIDSSVAVKLKAALVDAQTLVEEERRRCSRLGAAQAEAIVNSTLLLSNSDEEVQRLARAQAEAIVSAAMIVCDFENSIVRMRDELGKARVQLSKSDQDNAALAKAQAEAIINSVSMIAELQATKQLLKEAHESEALARIIAERLSSFGKILDSSNNEIYIFESESLRFLHVNHGARQNLGYSMEELREMTPLDIKKRLDSASFDDLTADLRSGVESTICFNTYYQRKDGSEYPVEVHLQISSFEEQPAFVAIVLDIAARLELETQLRDSREAAIQADRAKSEFLANMSHEIRTPMSAILGFSELLLESDVTEDERQSAVHTIQRNGQHLLQLINDILDLSKVESGKFEIERTKLNPVELVYDVVELLSERSEARGNSLIIETRGFIPQTILSDPTRLKQALVNLVGNAVKFTENGNVRVTVACDKSLELICFQVQDTGIGLSAEQLTRIFTPFGQADASTTRKYGGTGLGLAISKRIAEQLGGHIEVSSRQNEGSTFTLSVGTGSLAGTQVIESPRLSAEPRHQDTRTANLPALRGKLLLVEDGPDNQRLITYVLTKAGAEVVVAENGKIGLDKALKAWTAGSPFGVILMDMQMPVMDGYTAVGALRDAGYPGQVVALTAHAMKDDIDKCLAAGCDAYLSKPVNRQTLVTVVSERMGQPSQVVWPAGQCHPMSAQSS